MMGIAARWADEWNVWGTPETVCRHTTVFLAACDRVGRNPSAVHRSSQALVFLTDDAERAESMRARVAGDRALVGSPKQLVEQIGRDAELGLDEFILPDFTSGKSPEKRLETLERFATEVAAQLA